MTPHRSRRTRLNLVPLEDRANPASATISAAGTLTVTPDAGSSVAIHLNGFNTPGFLQVDVGATAIFTSSATQPVKSVVVNGSGVPNYAFTLAAGTALTDLTIRGAQTATTVAINPALISGNLSFVGTAGGNDAVTVAAGTAVNGSATFGMGGGNNTVNLPSLSVGGNLTVTGGADSDVVNVAAGGAVTVGGSWVMSLGGGINTVVGQAAQAVRVGKALTYAGGASQDVFDFFANNTALTVGGTAAFTMANVAPTLFDIAKFSALTVGGNLTYVGGVSNDFFQLNGGTTVGGGVTMTGGAGVNEFFLFNATVGGGVSFSGLGGTDVVGVENALVAKGVSVSLGNDDLSGAPFVVNQRLRLGNSAANAIGGALVVRGGNQADEIDVQRAVIGGALTISAGDGSDFVTLDDVDVHGTALIDLGAAADTLAVDSTNGFNNFTRFAGNLTVQAGAGDDFVDFSFNTGTQINFGGVVKLYGGAGINDTFRDGANFFVLPQASHFEDFENGNF